VEGRLEKQFFAKKGRKLLQATCSLFKSNFNASHQDMNSHRLQIPQIQLN